MFDIFSLTQMIKLLHAPICIYSREGEVLQALEEIDEEVVIEKKKFTKEVSLDFPYVRVDSEGLAYALLWSDIDKKFVGLGKVYIYPFSAEHERAYSYCKKDEFAAIISLIWRQITGKQVGIADIWSKNVFVDYRIREKLTRDIFELQEQGQRHNPYSQELREMDSIRRGDLEAFYASINEVYSGKVGTLAKDPVRQAKNFAICVISNAARSAIEGGLNPELAFSMSDIFIRNLEENLNDPLQIEKALRDAEVEFTKEVKRLRRDADLNPMINQVRDYVFCHSHEPIRVKDVAEYVGVTPNYLSDQFSQAMHVTLKQYIIDEKLKNSENLLKYTDYSLQEISSFCAFSSQSRFSSYFKRKNGITPVKYRKKFKKGRNE